MMIYNLNSFPIFFELYEQHNKMFETIEKIYPGNEK
jgi:hypothetical protein